MLRYPIYSRYCRCIVAGFVFLGIQMLTACAGDSPNSSMMSDTEKSSATLSIRWHHTPHIAAEEDSSTLDCQSLGIEQVACEVYDDTGNWLVSGGPWPCTASSGSILGIPAGPNRTFVALAEDLDGNIFYHGETAGVLIESDRITEGVLVDAFPFVPALSAPQENAEVDLAGFAFEWEELTNADQYLIQVDEESNFEIPLIDDTTSYNTYAPSALQPSTQYFWRVHAVDRFTNLGAPSEVRSFVTSDCTYSISSTDNFFGQEGGSGDFDVTASSADCQWIAAPNVDWIQVVQGAEGSGDGTVEYEVAANPAAAERTGNITAGGELYTITQEGVECAYQTILNQSNFDGSGGNGTIQVTTTAADCPWEAVSDAGWITIVSGAGGSGNGTVTFTVAANSLEGQRTGTITIEGEVHTIIQAGIECTYQTTLSQSNFGNLGGTGTIRITAGANCPWEAVSDADWLTIASGAGSGNGSVTFTVAANDSQGQRTATITVGGQAHTITQTGITSCTYQIEPMRREFNELTAYRISGGVGTIQVTATPANCQWQAAVDVDWIHISEENSSGTGSGTVEYTVEANDPAFGFGTRDPRTGIITIEDQTHTVVQAAPLLPDLRVTRFGVDDQAYLIDGSVTINISYLVVENIGSATVDITQFLFRLTGESGNQSEDYASWSSPIAPGVSSEVTPRRDEGGEGILVFTVSQPGTYTLEVMLNAWESFYEYDMSNNSATDQVEITQSYELVVE